MPENRLATLLEELQDELEKTEGASAETRERMHEVVADLRGVLEQRTPERSITDRLNEAVVEFESSHPQLGFLLERIGKTLSDIGI